MARRLPCSCLFPLAVSTGPFQAAVAPYLVSDHQWPVDKILLTTSSIALPSPGPTQPGPGQSGPGSLLPGLARLWQALAGLFPPPGPARLGPGPARPGPSPVRPSLPEGRLLSECFLSAPENSEHFLSDPESDPKDGEHFLSDPRNQHFQQTIFLAIV